MCGLFFIHSNSNPVRDKGGKEGEGGEGGLKKKCIYDINIAYTSNERACTLKFITFV